MSLTELAQALSAIVWKASANGTSAEAAEAHEKAAEAHCRAEAFYSQGAALMSKPTSERRADRNMADVHYEKFKTHRIESRMLRNVIADGGK